MSQKLDDLEQAPWPLWAPAALVVTWGQQQFLTGLLWGVNQVQNVSAELTAWPKRGDVIGVKFVTTVSNNSVLQKLPQEWIISGDLRVLCLNLSMVPQQVDSSPRVQEKES